MKFIMGQTAHDEEYVCLNMDQIACMTFYKDSNMTRVDTVIKGMPIWFDGNLIERLEYLFGLYDPENTHFMKAR